MTGAPAAAGDPREQAVAGLTATERTALEAVLSTSGQTIGERVARLTTYRGHLTPYESRRVHEAIQAITPGGNR